MKVGRRRRLRAPVVGLVQVPAVVVPIVVALFLLTQFSPTGEVECLCRPVQLPWATHAEELTLAPVVEVRRGEIVLAGEFLAPIGALDVETAAARLTELLGRSRESTVTIAADHELPFIAVWPVMKAAFLSGAATVSLAVTVPR